MKVWFDADNGPHVLIMRPLVEALSSMGHQVVFTARDRTKTPELMDLYGFSYRKVGGEFGKGKLSKITGTFDRAWSLIRVMRGQGIDVSFGHGSRALPIASRLLGIPSVTMYDYEWVNATIFNWGCRTILLPEAISLSRCLEAGISTAKVVRYPGYKEELYLGGREIEPGISADLGLRPDAVKVLLRPPATTAHYHNPEAELILDAILKKLASVEDLQLVYLVRTDDQLALPEKAGIRNVIVPNKVYDGPSLVAAVDLVISGGGTMTREAAIMGIPSYSFFRGRSGMVDEKLAAEGKLTLLASKEEVAELLRPEIKGKPAVQPAPEALVAFIAKAIVSAAGKSRSAR